MLLNNIYVAIAPPPFHMHFIHLFNLNSVFISDDSIFMLCFFCLVL